MKLSAVMFIGMAESVSEPIKSLQLLTGYSAESLNSNAFNKKSEKWRERWIQKFQRNAKRMEKSFNRCGFYDAEIHIEDYAYDTENVCKGTSMIINSFSTWVSNHLSSCSGQQNQNHHQRRLSKWAAILKNDLECGEESDKEVENPYTFVIPDLGNRPWWMEFQNDYAYVGESFKISLSCNPDFVDVYGLDCDSIANHNSGKFTNTIVPYCEAFSWVSIRFAVPNEHGILETNLQCPQCGCGADFPDRAKNLYDIYAKDLEDVIDFYGLEFVNNGQKNLYFHP